SRLGHRIARIDFDHVVVSPMDDHVGIIGIPFRCAPAPHATLVLAPEVRDDMAFVAISRKDAPAHGLAVLAAGAGAACAALICSSTTPTTPTAVSATTRAACTCACWACGCLPVAAVAGSASSAALKATSCVCTRFNCGHAIAAICCALSC